MPLFVIERNYAEQLELSTDGVRLIEDVNADEGVRWLFSFLTADRRRTYCLYEAPSPDAIVAAAERAGLPADVVIEVEQRLGRHVRLSRSSAPFASTAAGTTSSSRCAVSGENAGRQTATYSAPSSAGVE